MQFDHPVLLLVSLLAVPLLLLGWRAMRGQDALRRTVALGLRAVLLVTLAVMLAGPRAMREHDRLTVIGVLDVSGSIRRFAELPPAEDLVSASSVQRLRAWLRDATATRGDDDRFGLIVFDGRAVAVAVPTSGDYVDDALDVRLAEGTNIAEAIELGLAMFPADTARRLVLVTDGNQTMGDALVAARQAAGGAAG
ncbi:MAG: VWA domain-containing protein, partial [Planctomycetota bacterium]